MQTEERLIAEAAQANRALGASGQSDMVWGHASVRDPEGRGIWMKAAGWSFEELSAGRVVLVTPAGEVLAGTERRHIEYPIHTELMNARPDVGSVVHTHAPAAVAFAALDEPLLAISHDGVEFAEPQIARFTQTGSLISSAGLGQALAKTIGDGVGCLIPRHGLVTVGPDAATAVMRARAARPGVPCPAAGDGGRPDPPVVRSGRDRPEEGGGLAGITDQRRICLPVPPVRLTCGLANGMIRAMREIAVGVVAPAYVNVPLWVAQQRGLLERCGLRATERILGTTHGVTNALRGGEVDIALTAPEGSIADAMAGGPLRVVAGLIDRPPLSMIALPRHHAFGDLRGGRIGTSSLKEGTRHVAERMLAAHGLAYPADYEFVLEGSHVERWKALQAGAIDAALQMLPYDYIATDAGFTNLGPVTEEFALNAVCISQLAERAGSRTSCKPCPKQRNGSAATSRSRRLSPRRAHRSSHATPCGPVRRWPPTGLSRGICGPGPAPSPRRSTHCGPAA